MVRSNLGDYESAIVDFDAAIRLNSDYAEVYNNRGNVRVCQGDYESAIVDFDAAIRLNPDYAQAYNGEVVPRQD